MIAIYIDHKLKKSENEIKYSFSFIFKTLGYEFKFVTQLDQILPNDILIYYTSDNLTMKETHQLAMNRLFFHIPTFEELLQPGKMTQAEIENYTQEIMLNKKIPVIHKEMIRYPIQYFKQKEIFIAKLNFDLVGNIFFHLINYNEVGKKNYPLKDEDICFSNYHLVPFVNNLLWLMENCIQDTIQQQKKYFILKKEFWPQSENIGVSFSHSIPTLRKWTWKKIFQTSLQDIFQFFRIKIVIKNFLSMWKYILTNIEEYWNFSIINELENLHDVNSTFFFGISLKNVVSFDYKITNKNVRNEIKSNLAQGNEVSLLASADINFSNELARQKEELCLLTSAKKIGIRHYMGKFDPQKTTEIHKKNGFDYDSSETFLNRLGFKHGIAFPYHLHPLKKFGKKSRFQFQTRYFELPISFSDHALRINDETFIPVEQIQKYYHEIIEALEFCKGYLHFDLSVANFTDIKYLKGLYRYILEDLKTRNAFIAPCIEIANWWKKRESVEISESETGVLIYFPDRFKRFSFRLIGNFSIISIDGAKAEIKENLIKFIDIQPDTKVQIFLSKKNPDGNNECEKF